MENEEKRKHENRFTEKFCDTSCCGWQGMSEAMTKCCEGISGTGGCRTMMVECMRNCRWFLLIPVIIGILLLLLGFVLDAEVTRILWMTAAGLVILMGAFGFFMMSLSKRAYR